MLSGRAPIQIRPMHLHPQTTAVTGVIGCMWLNKPDSSDSFAFRAWACPRFDCSRGPTFRNKTSPVPRCGLFTSVPHAEHLQGRPHGRLQLGEVTFDGLLPLGATALNGRQEQLEAMVIVHSMEL